MSDPRISALVCVIVVLWLGYSIVTATEATNIFLHVLQWTFFLVATAGLAVALARIIKGRRGD
jgi:membrane protein DedA with SNARE-associated domain